MHCVPLLLGTHKVLCVIHSFITQNIENAVATRMLRWQGVQC